MAAPQIASTTPARAMKIPQKATATRAMRPRRRAWDIQPVVSAATVDPAATEA